MALLLRRAATWPVRVAILVVAASILVGVLLWAASRGDTDHSSGIFALAGILAGGLITGATTWLFERRREEADLRQAKRLVAEELRTVYFHYETAAKERRPPDSMDGFVPDEQWQARRDVLARHLPDKVWDTLSPFMDSITSSRRLVARTSPGTSFPTAVVEMLTGAAELARDAYVLLTGDEPEAF